jgi:RHS repeat-associated protein
VNLQAARSLAAPVLKAGSSSELPLYPGWNLVSIARQPGNPSPAAVFSGAASRAFAYDACDTADPWKVWDPADPSGSDLTSVDPKKGLWAEVPAAVVLPVAGTEPTTTTIHLCPGWNLIGAPLSQPRSVAGALSSIAGKYSRVFAYDGANAADPWDVYDIAVPTWANTLQVLEPCRGYWVLATAEADLVLSNNVTGPAVQIVSPADLSEVTTRINVVGTVTGDLIQEWTLSYRAAGDAQWTQIGSGTTPVINGVLGTFDPTLLLNGNYQLQLTATDANNLEQSVQVDIAVEGQQKIGNFTLTYQDLEVPVSGLRIQILRTYDSRDKRQGDFGVGWTLDIHQGSYKNNRPPGEGWQFASGFLPCQFIGETRGHMTTIRLSDREIYRFKLALSNGAPTLGGCFGQARFDFVDGPVPGATLAILGNTQVLYQNGGNEVVDASSLEIYEPQSVRLTTRNGRIFDLTLQQGVTRLEDLNGNELSIAPTGITHSSGRAVLFERDGQGRITRIIDPEGESLIYEYDAAGDLITVTDREEQATRFTYTNHLLADIQDARGIKPIRNEYDASGRLLRTTDAFDKTIEFDHDLANSREVVTDRLGHSRVLEYDARGNVVRETDALGKVTSRLFDDHDRLLSETDPLNHITTYTYNGAGDLTLVRDPLEHTTSYTYNARGQVLTTTDARSKTTTNTYDTAGNLLQTTDPLDHSTAYTHDSRGNLLTQTDARNAVTTYVYDGHGNLTQQTDALGTVTTYTYDGNGNRLTETTSRTLPNGTRETLTTTFGYDRLGRLISTARPDGSTLSTTYNAIGQIAEAIDPLGRHTTFTYDDLGRQTEIHYPDATSESRTYDAEGRMLTATDRSGHLTTYVYDAVGRLVKTVFADNSFTTSTYDDAGRLIATTDARNNTTTFEYNAAGRRTRVIDALSGQTDFQYDGAGNQISVTDPNRRTTGFVYDDAGRQTQTIYPDATTKTVEYDELGRRVAETDQAGKTTRFGYDALGRLLSVTDALNQVTRYAYDETGNRVSQTDANNHITRFEFDAAGRMTRRVLPDDVSETLSYDLAGNLTSKTDFMGRTIGFAYDLSNRLKQKTYPDTTSVSFTYTSTGRRATMTEARGTTTYTYDSRDRLVEMAYPDGRKLTYAWDANGNRAELTAHVAGQVLTTRYTYDALNRLDTVTDPRGKVYDHGYDPNGNRTSMTYPNGVQTTYSYDVLNRLTELRSQTDVGAVVQSYLYTLGVAGNRMKIEEHDGTVRGYGYDALYRLTDETVTNGGTPVYSKVFGYDPVGNRLQQVHTDAAGTVTTTNATYDTRDRQLTRGSQSWTWNANGSLAAKVNEATYAWDFDDRLLSATLADGTVVTQAYDADGVRVRTETRKSNGITTTVEYLVDTSTTLSQVVAEITGSEVSAYYVRGDDLLAVIRPGAPENWKSRYYHADGLGSIRVLSDETGVVTDRYSFTAFGELLAHEGEDVNAYLFAGEPLDPNSGFYYNRARWMDPGAGRFMSMDPFLGFLPDPLSLHRYSYVGGNPVGSIDPTGLAADVGNLSGLLIAGSLLAVLAAAVIPKTGIETLRRSHGFVVVLQAQGSHLQTSVRLQNFHPITVIEGLLGLAALENMLTRRELGMRNLAFDAARAWIISRPPMGAGPPGRSGFTNPGISGSVARVDVAIFSGTNFIF